MAIFRFTNVGGFGTYQRYNDFLAGNPAYFVPDNGAMFPIGTVTLASAQSTIVFSNIPQTYTHLQLRGILRSAASQGASNARLRVNGTVANYLQQLVGSGSGTATSGNYTDGAGTNSIWFQSVIANTGTANVYSGFVADIVDYRNTNKTKGVRTLTGYDANGSGNIVISSNIFTSTSAITSLTLEHWDAGGWMANSSVALYGVLA